MWLSIREGLAADLEISRDRGSIHEVPLPQS